MRREGKGRRGMECNRGTLIAMSMVALRYSRATPILRGKEEEGRRRRGKEEEEERKRRRRRRRGK